MEKFDTAFNAWGLPDEDMIMGNSDGCPTDSPTAAPTTARPTTGSPTSSPSKLPTLSTVCIASQGQYVRLERHLEVAELLNFAEIEVFAIVDGVEKNVALQSEGGIVKLSAARNGYDPYNAIDGIQSPETVYGTTVADFNLNPWWQVKLSQPYQITKIVVWNRQDGVATHRLSDAVLSIYDVDPSTNPDAPSLADMTIIGDSTDIDSFAFSVESCFVNTSPGTPTSASPTTTNPTTASPTKSPAETKWDFIQMDDWRISTASSCLSIASDNIKTAQIFCSGGTTHKGPRSDYNGWAYGAIHGPTHEVGPVFGTMAVELKEWRITQIDDSHLSVSHSSGNVARIYRSDGTLHGNNQAYSGWQQELGVAKCAFVTANYLQIGDWRIGSMSYANLPTYGFLAVQHKNTGRTAVVYRTDGTVHPRMEKFDTAFNAWGLPDEDVIMGNSDGCPTDSPTAAPTTARPTTGSPTSSPSKLPTLSTTLQRELQYIPNSYSCENCPAA